MDGHRSLTDVPIMFPEVSESFKEIKIFSSINLLFYIVQLHAIAKFKWKFILCILVPAVRFLVSSPLFSLLFLPLLHVFAKLVFDSFTSLFILLGHHSTNCTLVRELWFSSILALFSLVFPKFYHIHQCYFVKKKKNYMN